ncbi:TrkA-C domain protein [halophilic archaeon]|nr:TrkA-C domain protein [halophilic archaeon]
MIAMYRILTVLLIFALSLLIVRIGSIALRMTGLSPDIASFQSISAFSGTGYTTEEAEQTVSTPGRRKTVKALIRLGSIGLIGALASLTLSFTKSNTNDSLTIAYILGGSSFLILAARSRWLNTFITPLIERALRRTTDLEITDYKKLLGLQSEYDVADINVGEESWLANATPRDLKLGDEGVLLLGIKRDDSYIGAPDSNTEVKPGDTVILYGKEDRLQELSNRRTGDDQAHEDAVNDHNEILEEQKDLLNQ